MTDVDDYLERWAVLRSRAVAAGAQGLAIGTGKDLAYLTGHGGQSWERLTAVVAATAPDTGPALFITPKLEAEGITAIPEVFTFAPWEDSDDPIALAVPELPARGRILVSDGLPSQHLLALQRALPGAEFLALNETLGGMRALKTAAERQALRTVGGLVDLVHDQIRNGEVPLVGRSELEVQDDVRRRLLAVGHETVEFVIVASGPNSASPHHHPGDRVIQAHEMVLFDFGGSLNGFNSDMTRCVFTGPIPDDVGDAWASLREAQELAFRAAQPGARLGDVDLAARSSLEAAGYGPEFIHRTGHGIGTEVHEHPYVTSNNDQSIEVGHAFSIEPGIYRVGKWGMRLEDIVVIDDDGPVRCNNTDRDLANVGSD